MIKTGQRYITNEDIKITCMTSWKTPYTGGYDRILQTGEEFIIANDPPKGATAVYANPINYKKLHKKFVPWTDRMRIFLYAGYYLCIELKKIDKSCSLIFGDSK